MCKQRDGVWLVGAQWELDGGLGPGCYLLYQISAIDTWKLEMRAKAAVAVAGGGWLCVVCGLFYCLVHATHCVAIAITAAFRTA